MPSIENPRLTLRVGIAGSREMSQNQQYRSTTRLTEIYSLVTETIEALAPGVPPFAENPVLVSYYKGKPPADGQAPDPDAFPLLRVVGGLADGADQLAFHCLLDFKARAMSSAHGPGRHTEYELVAVLPCEPITFRTNSKVENTRSFDELLGRCTCVIELDGICDPKSENPPDSPLVRRRRERSFLSQARVLLRQCDVLIAASASTSEGRIGGTRQTVLAAVEMGIPVIYLSVSADCDSVAVIKERADLDEDPAAEHPHWREDIREVLVRILAGPERTAATPSEAGGTLKPDERQMLEEFFASGTWHKSVRQKLWSRFELRFRPQQTNARLPAQTDAHIEYFRRYRSRASEMSAYYAGKYRGTFLENYTLAAIAVFLAVSALVWVIFNLYVRVPRWLSLSALLALAVLKLIALVVIYRNARCGNEEHLNDKAIDSRYLSERLRTFYYLPLVGSLHVSPPRSARYAGRELRENVVSWLLNAIVRQAPAHTGLERVDPPAENMWQPVPDRPLPTFCRVNVPVAAERIRYSWLETQIAYHGRQALTQKNMYEWIEAGMSASNRLVIFLVSLDLLILFLGILTLTLEKQVELLEWLHTLSPALLFFAAVLPAVVASLNGLSFQSECKRIATRSAAVRSILGNRKREWDHFADQLSQAKLDQANPASWVLRAIDLAESCAQVVTDEVAEWSVLYSRDLTDI